MTSWSEQSTPAELSMASVLMRPPARAYSTRGASGEAQVAALGHHPAPQLGGVDSHRVVGAIADVGVGLRRRLHERTDPAVPEEVDL